MNYQKGKLEVNESMTKKVIELHDKGYNFDFLLIGEKFLLCMQNNNSYPLKDVMVSSVKRAYDRFSHSYKHIHTIETSSGEKGVLLTDYLFN
ncbi:hypothetical protein [Pedobacter mendelii]|uniref:Uncharacterized protein n=1 Tax=Pedobacter mendelii TaxID=1908240 RepID=A0ABQ2BJR3_9SPHI|nr:hypothetical protein [Pedobacter mendelii]GGI26304.1 hypothetical protein GCM10008119_21990 [Pedobacter mendelii]